MIALVLLRESVLMPLSTRHGVIVICNRNQL